MMPWSLSHSYDIASYAPPKAISFFFKNVYTCRRSKVIEAISYFPNWCKMQFRLQLNQKQKKKKKIRDGRNNDKSCVPRSSIKALRLIAAFTMSWIETNNEKLWYAENWSSQNCKIIKSTFQPFISRQSANATSILSLFFIKFSYTLQYNGRILFGMSGD